MSIFQNQVQGVQEIEARISDASATDIVDATDGAWYVPWFQVNENAGGTPSVTVSMTDGTKVRYLGSDGATIRAKALTANQSVDFNKGYSVPVGWKLQVTSNDAAGRLDVIGLKVRRVTG